MVKIMGCCFSSQDHAQLFNDHLKRWNDLQSCVAELKSMFPDENRNQTLEGCFQHISELCEDVDGIGVKRKLKYCMEVEYDGKVTPHVVIPAFLAFNKANRLIKDIIDKGQPMVSSISLVVSDEKALRRDVLVESLGADGPMCMKNCMENVAELKKVPLEVDQIHTGASKVFEQLKNAVNVLINLETNPESNTNASA